MDKKTTSDSRSYRCHKVCNTVIYRLIMQLYFLFLCNLLAGGINLISLSRVIGTKPVFITYGFV